MIDALLPQGVKTFYNWIEVTVAKRTKLEEQIGKQESDQSKARKDMFHYFFQAKDPETGGPAYTADDLWMEAHLLIIAGSDTSTTAFAGTLFYITRYPRVYARLVQEIRTTFQTADEIRSGTKLLGCRYLRACLDESMRMSPPAPGEMTREVMAGGLEVDGMLVPAGTQIGTSAYSLHHNESVFPDPFVYRPERWIVDEDKGVSADDVARAESAWVPFSAGPRACVGKNLAYMQLTIILARLLHQLDIKQPENNVLGEGAPDLIWGRRIRNQFQLKDEFIGYKEGPMAQFRKRQT